MITPMILLSLVERKRIKYNTVEIISRVKDTVSYFGFYSPTVVFYRTTDNQAAISIEARGYQVSFPLYKVQAADYDIGFNSLVLEVNF